MKYTGYPSIESLLFWNFYLNKRYLTEVFLSFDLFNVIKLSQIMRNKQNFYYLNYF